MIEEKDLREMLDRFARTPDGQLFYRYCQKQLCAIATSENDSALREHQGRRRFAADLMALMAKGIEDSDRPITFSVSGARSTATGARGAARRVTLDTAVSGWDSPDTGPADGKPS